MQSVIIVHGWGGSPTADWYPWLSTELRRRGATVKVPALPNPDAPRIEGWVNELSAVLRTSDTPLTLVGHSIGCQTILRALGTPDWPAIDRCVLVAPWLTLQNLSEEERTIAEPWLTTPIDFEAVRRRCPSFTVLLSDDDPYVPIANADLFQSKLHARVIVEHGKKHFTEADGITSLPEILPLIT